MKFDILLIEDNPGDIELIKIYLDNEKNAYQITEANSFSEAKDHIVYSDKSFDAILLDLSLPDLSGKLVVDKILELAPLVPVIILTGLRDFQFSITALNLGVSDYLFKDELNSLDLNKSIFHNIERKKLINKLKATEQKYKNFFRTSSSPVFVWDNELERIIDCNRAALEIYGFTLSEFYQMSIKKIHPIGEDFQVANNISRDTSKFLKHKTKNGRLLFMTVSGYLKNYNNANASLIILKDVTEEFSKKEEEQDSYIFSKLFSQSELPKLVLEQNTFRILNANKKAIQFLDLNSDQINEVSFLEKLSLTQQSQFRINCSILSTSNPNKSLTEIFSLSNRNGAGYCKISITDFFYNNQQNILVELSPYKFVHKQDSYLNISV